MLRSRRTIPLPLSPEHWAALSVEVPLTVTEWEQLRVTLEAMRPGLVEDNTDGA